MKVHSIAFAIDTDTYAGNFERQMTAYVTGEIGDCGVGEKQAQRAQKEEMAVEEYNQYFSFLDNLIAQVSDDHGCFRPAGVGPVPGKNENNAVEIYLNRMPTRDEAILMCERARKYIEVSHEFGEYDDHRDVKILGFRIIKRKIEEDSTRIDESTGRAWSIDS